MNRTSINVESNKWGRTIEFLFKEILKLSFSYEPNMVPNSFSSAVGLDCEFVVALSQ